MPNILRAKCIVVGDSAVGKTAAVQAFNNDTNVFPKNYNMTTGVDLVVKTVSVPDTNDAVELYLYDSSGKDMYLDMLQKVWFHPSLVCVVFDVTNENSFNDCSQWLKRVKSVSNMALTGVLLGTKVDLKERRIVTLKEAQELSKNLKLQYFECSAKSCEGVDEPFYYLVNEWHKMYIEKTDFLKTLS